MEELPPELKIRAGKELELSMSITNWLKVADALEEQSGREGSFEQQMAHQIRMFCVEALAEKEE